MLLQRFQDRLAEQRTGVYDFAAMQFEIQTLRPPHLDHATYIGPIEVRNTKTKGRGVFTTKSVKAGDLLLCEKAFSHSYASEDGGAGKSRVSLLVNPERNRCTMGTQADLIKAIAQKLYRNPSLARAFTTLFHGDYEAVTTSSVDGKPVVDT